MMGYVDKKHVFPAAICIKTEMLEKVGGPNMAHNDPQYPTMTHMIPHGTRRGYKAA